MMTVAKHYTIEVDECGNCSDIAVKTRHQPLGYGYITRSQRAA